MTDCPPMSDERRREIFLALVEAQDQSMTVSQSRDHVAQQFSITPVLVRQIEREGLNSGWPPL
jgi:hypothetical protein